MGYRVIDANRFDDLRTFQNRASVISIDKRAGICAYWFAFTYMHLDPAAAYHCWSDASTVLCAHQDNMLALELNKSASGTVKMSAT